MSRSPFFLRGVSGHVGAAILLAALPAPARADSPPPSPAALQEARDIFGGRCSPCHGPGGAGDGPTAVALTPPPTNFTAAAWQQSVTDEAIATAITAGGPAVGKSPLMPPNPDLVEKPDVVAALVAHLRGMAPAAGEAPAASTAAAAPAATGSGEDLFRTTCAACHTINGGKLVGPDLAGVHERRSADWLRRFIRSSQSMVSAGDPDAVQLFADYNSLLMPDAPYDDAQIDSILAFMAGVSDAGGTFSLVPAGAVTRAATPVDIQRGRELFQGRERFENEGPACNSCHDVQNDAVIGGGVLAKDLTSTFASMGGAGVRAILGQPPFPVMEQAYRGRGLNEEEIFALVAFLQDADAQKAFQQPRDYGMRLLGSGLVGLVVLLGLYSLIWSRRKKLAVNHEIFARQVRST